MKLALAFVLSWILWALGDLACRVLMLAGLDRFERWVAVWFPVYTWLMLRSSDVQEWAGGDRWFPWGLAGDVLDQDDSEKPELNVENEGAAEEYGLPLVGGGYAKPGSIGARSADGAAVAGRGRD